MKTTFRVKRTETTRTTKTVTVVVTAANDNSVQPPPPATRQPIVTGAPGHKCFDIAACDACQDTVIDADFMRARFGREKIEAYKPLRVLKKAA